MLTEGKSILDIFGIKIKYQYIKKNLFYVKIYINVQLQQRSPDPMCLLSPYTHGSSLLADLRTASADLRSYQNESLAKESVELYR